MGHCKPTDLRGVPRQRKVPWSGHLWDQSRGLDTRCRPQKRRSSGNGGIVVPRLAERCIVPAQFHTNRGSSPILRWFLDRGGMFSGNRLGMEQGPENLPANAIYLRVAIQTKAGNHWNRFGRSGRWQDGTGCDSPALLHDGLQVGFFHDSPCTIVGIVHSTSILPTSKTTLPFFFRSSINSRLRRMFASSSRM